MGVTATEIKQLAAECGFELAGVTAAEPSADFTRFERWRDQGLAGEMRYLTDERGDKRRDPRDLLPSARSILCVGKLYNNSSPYSTGRDGRDGRGWIARYAAGKDYHDVLRRDLETLLAKLRALSPQAFEARICVDTAPLLERSYARAAGLGWIGKNTCLINQASGSWFFLGEVLLSLELESGTPPPARCGSCTRCIDACPTEAIVPDGGGGWRLDARLCISYLTIEKRGAIDPRLAAQTGHHVFGCDICQDVCPWNGQAPLTTDAAFAPRHTAPALAELAALTEEEFRAIFRRSPVWRARYSGFLRNVACAIGNSENAELLPLLDRLAAHSDPLVARSAREAQTRLASPAAPPS